MAGREIFYDPQAYLKLAALGYDYRRIDDRMGGIEWALSQHAEAFPEVNLVGAPRVRVARVLGDDKDPTLRVLFRIDSDTELTVLWIDTV